MLMGAADPEAWREGAPKMSALTTEPVSFRGASVLQVLCEVENDNAELLPPALHPTLPGVVGWQVYDFPESPWGAFRLAQTRIECRSGTRPRGLLVSGVIDNAAAREALTARWGYRLHAGEIDFRRGYDGVEVVVGGPQGDPILVLGLQDPVLLPPDVVQFVSSVHPAETPNGYRLVQVEPRYQVNRAERGDPVIELFDAEAWGESRIAPVYPISAALCLTDVTLPTLRFLCRPGELAFTGTESLPMS
jgi:hypothetical protein